MFLITPWNPIFTIFTQLLCWATTKQSNMLWFVIFFQMINLYWTKCPLKGHWTVDPWATSLLFPLWKGCGPSYVPGLVEISSVFLEKKWKCVKLTDRQKDGQHVIRKAHLSFSLGELKTYYVLLYWEFQHFHCLYHSILPQICCQIIIANLATIIRRISYL